MRPYSSDGDRLLLVAGGNMHILESFHGRVRVCNPTEQAQWNRPIAGVFQCLTTSDVYRTRN